MKSNIAVLILAAGASSRMGTPKQILPWKDTTLLGHAIRTAKASQTAKIFVVLGANSEEIRPTISEEGIVVLNNQNWQNGLGTSIAAGIEQFKTNEKLYDAVLIMLVDQPLISADYLNQLIQSFHESKKGIVATAYGSRAGVPAIFSPTYFSELGKLNDDYGAKKILNNHDSDLITLYPKGIEQDVDTPDHYKALLKSSLKEK